MGMEKVERLKVWLADAEWDDDVEVVRASDYDRVAAELRQSQDAYQRLIDQTTPLAPDPKDPRWSKRIQLDEVIAERDQLRAENERLRALLLEASEEIDSWGSYASEYFQQKHDLPGAVAKFHYAAMAKDDGA